MAKNLKSVYVRVKQNDEDRRENDLYETPPLATFILQKYLDVPKNVVEPCAGRGNIAIELSRGGHNVLAFDLNEYENMLFPVTTGQDVLSLQKPEGYNAFITNPPYFKDLPRKIAEKGVDEYDFTALFVRLTFLEGQKRYKLFANNPPSDIIFLSDRIKFKPNMKVEPIEMDDQIGGMIAYMWIVWDKRYETKNTNCRWVILKDEYDEWLSNYYKWKGKQ
jgi:methylase of polypeptide subunit release factors